MTKARVLLDTGPLVALLAEPDSYHRRCVETLATLSPPLLTCWPVITEAAWILRKQPRPLDRIAQAHAGGMFEILPLNGGSLDEIAAIMARYEDIKLQFADAALVHLAERENIRTCSPPAAGISRSSASNATARSNSSRHPMSERSSSRQARTARKRGSGMNGSAA